tara:strand:+ start:10066 stop:10176 length:111 start_codon:yes stop_codon:yes gene_type:complete
MANLKYKSIKTACNRALTPEIASFTGFFIFSLISLL